MSDLEDLRIINEMTYIVWLHSVYFIMGSVQESLSNHVQHPVYCNVDTQSLPRVVGPYTLSSLCQES